MVQKMRNDRLIKKVLKDVNKIREAFGLKTLAEMPKGKPEILSRCPIAQGLGIRSQVTGSEILVRSRKQADIIAKVLGKNVHANVLGSKTYKWVVHTPEHFEMFVERFDSTVSDKRSKLMTHLVLDTPRHRVGK